jgi:agmatine/peptidylarginine deiminase
MTLLLVVLLAITPVENDEFLPQWMTAEELLRVDEIGKGHVVTAPPGGWVETPGEFEKLRGVFITWRYGYGSGLDVIFREIVREVVDVSKAYIIIRSGSEQSNVTSYLNNGGVALDSVEFYQYSNNSIWIRDYGPWFMRKADNSEGIVDFQYNRPRPLDDTIPWRIGASWSIPVYGSPLEHAGGNFMVDGLGSGFASDLIYDENPGYSAQEIDSLMLAYCGLEQFVVVPKINIEYTGHIDLWTKILNDTLVLVGEYESGHPNYNILNQHAALIASYKNRDGINYRVARIPMPWSMSDAPPSYLNSLIVNNKVLVPLWDEQEDSLAITIYEQLMPDHQIVGINCSYMAGSGGAIHCITMQIPSAAFLHVKHSPLPDSTSDTLNDYRVRAEITTSSSLEIDSTVVFYKIGSSSPFIATPLAAVGDTPGVYAGYIPAQSPGDTVFYFLLAKNNEPLRRTSPTHCPPHIYSFRITGSVGVQTDEKEVFVPRVRVFPNPARYRMIFSLQTGGETTATISLFNVLGQLVQGAEKRHLSSGENQLSIKLVDKTGKPLPHGVYFYTVNIGGFVCRDKILIMR